MLNKKIVSLISAFAMTLSVISFATVANAAGEPAADLTYKIEKNIFDQDTYDAGYQEYTLTVSLKTANIQLTDNGKAGALKRYSGTRVANFAGQVKFDTSKLYTESSMITVNVSGGSAIASPLEGTGFTFNWYTNTYTEMLEAEDTTLFTVNLYAMDADGNATIGADEDISTYFSWVPMTRSVNYRTWDTVAGGNMDLSGNYTYSVLADNSALDGYVGPLGIGAATPDKYAVTVTGGTADATEAEEGQTVTVIAEIPEGQQIKSVTGAADLIQTSNTTYTFTMPAEAVTIVFEYEGIPAPEFIATIDDSLAPYYTKSGKLTRIGCTLENMSADKTKLNLVFTSNGTDKTFVTDKPVIGGEAQTVFEAWILNAPETVTLVVTEAE